MIAPAVTKRGCASDNEKREDSAGLGPTDRESRGRNGRRWYTPGQPCHRRRVMARAEEHIRFIKENLGAWLAVSVGALVVAARKLRP